MPAVLPLPFETNQIDYPKFISRGVQIANGLSGGLTYVPGYGDYPLASLAFTAPYLLFQGSRDWFMLTGWLGTLALYVGLWASTYALWREFAASLQLPGARALPLLSSLLLFLTPIPSILLREAPYALFPIIAALALWRLLVLARTKRVRDAAITAALLGAVILTRSDGLWIAGWCAGAIAVLALRWERTGTWAPARRQRALLAAAVLGPMLVVPGAYLVAHKAVNRTWSPQLQRMAERSYLYFEMGNVDSMSALTGLADRMARTRAVFGTAAENHSSVFAAALRNPPAMAARLAGNILDAWRGFASAYGNLLGPVVAALLVLGAACALRSGLRFPLLALVGAGGFLVLYAPFYWDRSFLAMAVFVVMPMAGCGLLAIWRACIALLPSHSRLRTATVAVLGAAALLVLSVDRYPNGVPLRGIPALGASSEEQVAAYLGQRLLPGALVASTSTLVPAMARLQTESMVVLQFEDDGGGVDAVRAWLDRRAPDAVYLSPDLQILSPKRYAALRYQLGLQEAFVWEEQLEDRRRGCAQVGVPCTHVVLVKPARFH